MPPVRHDPAKGQRVEKPHKCKWSGHTLSRECSLANRTLLRCTDRGCCTMSFNRKSDLERHHKIHTGEKPFRCDFPGCGHSARQQCALNTHKRTHTGDKPYLCQEPNCEKSRIGNGFSDSSSLSRHKKTHTGEKKWECERCGQRYARRPSLMRHVEQNSCLRQSAQRAGYWSFLGGTFQHPPQPALGQSQLAQSQPMTRSSSRGSQASLTSSQGTYESEDIDPDIQASESLPQQFQISSQYMDSVNYHQTLPTHMETSDMMMQQQYLQPVAEQAVSQSHNAAYDFLGHNLPGTALVDPMDSQIDYSRPPIFSQNNQLYHSTLHNYVDYDILSPPNIQSTFIPSPTYYQPPVDNGQQLIYVEQPNLTGQMPTVPYGGISYGY